MRFSNPLAALAATVLFLSARPAHAFDTGVSDDRVSLPEGPGSLEGVGENVSVDPNMGLMRFNIPLTAPQGFPGVTPELSLRYASASGSGVVGMGWMMTHPTIERMTMRGVPRYDETDLFVSEGGSELVRVSDGASSTAPAIYRSRFESDFTRFRWHERQGGRGGYWEAQYADGRRGFFGADAQGRPVATAVEAGRDGTFKYHLVELVDVHDHRMVMSYVKDGAISLLSEISYVFTSATPTYRVQLAYEGRSDAVSDAKPGFERRLTQRLTEVRVTVRGQPLRRFALSYQADATTGRRTRLAQVRTFGANGELYPIVHRFDYSRGLGAQCESADCGRPLLVTMVGDQGLGVAFQSGTTNLVDINGDALPDLVDAASTQARHRFFLNQLGSDGSHGFSAAQTSAVGEVSDFALGNSRVQFIDVNGDGFTDLLRGGTADQRVLINRGAGDWVEALELNGTNAFTGVDAELRFMDYDNDMDVDMLRSTDTQTFVFENDGNFEFVGRQLEPLGVAFSENLQFTDVNGDGLLDVVRLQPNQLQYKLNFGRGRFSPRFETVSHPFGAGEIAQALIEDLDSDGFADIVVVSGNTVRYVLSRSGEAFEPVQSLSEVGANALPNREATTTVLAADMNGNGSIDIVWVGGTGSVRYLDLFPVRSHLLTRIENGIGRVTDIEYQPSVEQRARSREEGQPWVHPLPYPMVVVSRTDEYDLLTDVRDVVEFRYRDGFYDGVERQFRGYAEVLRRHPGEASQEEGRTLSRFDVGIEAPHLNGKLLLETRESGGRVIDETTRSYGDDSTCPVAEVPSAAALAQLGRRAVRFPCEIEKVTVVQEGLTRDRWVTTRTTRRYDDGYGNVTREVNEGVIAVGGGACDACSRPSGTFGAPCGNQCLGDESFMETTFVPVSNAGGRWLLRKAARTRRFGTEGNADGFFSEEINFYDGEAFVGLAEGQLTKGLLSRQTRRVDDAKVLTTERQRFDRHGNAVDRLDPLGTPGGTTHRRTYAYDEDGLRVTRVDIFNETDGEAYRLRRETQYDLLFDKVTLATAWMLVEGGQVTTSRDPTAYTYDSFGRVSSILQPGGDTGAAPTVEISYELGSPTTRLITRRRSEVGGPLDLESIACLDGRGRTFQTRTKTAEGTYTVDGFTVFNLRSEPLRVFQAYTGGAACDTAPPAGTLSTTYRYDGVGRRVGVEHPDEERAGGPVVERMAYEPLRVLTFDGEDNDSASPHADTPTVVTSDGLGRTVAQERRLTNDIAVTQLLYDGLGYLAGYVDAAGHRKSQTHDATGRLLEVVDPNSGTSRMTYDDANNLVRRVDGRGVEVAYVYDGLNRKTEVFDVSDRDGSLITMSYDRSTGCDASRCPNGAGYMVLKRYPGGADFLGRDVRRRPFSLVRVIEGQTYVLGSRHDNADRLIERIYPDGRSLVYAYDDAGRLASIPGVLDAVEYEERGVVSRLAYTHGVTESRRYDARLQLDGYDVLDASGALLQALTVQRDRASNVTAVEDDAAEALRGPMSHALDAWYRSVEVSRGGARESFTFDAIDNIVRRGDLTYAYERAGSATTVGTEARRHDGAGYLLEGEGMRHDWDFLGRLVRTEGSAGPVRSVYGADHLRVARHAGDEVTHYVAKDFEVRDGVSVIYPMVGRARIARLESTDFAGAWLTGQADSFSLTAGEVFVRAPAADREAWLTASARAVLSRGWPSLVGLHHDELGSVVLATGAEGAVLGRQSFGHFGAKAASTGFVDRRGFTGQEQEPTGLIRFAQRVLSPADGRWLSPDPAFQALTQDALDRLPEAVARYSYVLNSPGTNVDPEGLFRKRAAAALRAFGRGVKARASKLKRSVGDRLAGIRRPIGNRLQRIFRPAAARRASFRRRNAAEIEAFRQELRDMPQPERASRRNRNYSIDSLDSISDLLSVRPPSTESLVAYVSQPFSAFSEGAGGRPASRQINAARPIPPLPAVQYRPSQVRSNLLRMSGSSSGSGWSGPSL